MRHLLTILSSLSVLVMLTMGCSSRKDRELSEALADLDLAIAERPSREEKKLEYIQSLKLACFRSPTYEQRVPLARQIVREYFSYNLDSTRTWIACPVPAGRQHPGEFPAGGRQLLDPAQDRVRRFPDDHL